MTREQIEELRRYHDEATAAVSCAGHDDGEWCEFCTALSKMATFAANNASALLAAAERALDLEDALRLFFAEADSDERGNLWAGRETISKLCTAYSAKVKP